MLQKVAQERDPRWELRAASVVLVLGEVLFGTSPGWQIVGMRNSW